MLSAENVGHLCLPGLFAAMTQPEKSACKGLEHLGSLQMFAWPCVCVSPGGVQERPVGRGVAWVGMTEGDGSCLCVGDSSCICQWGCRDQSLSEGTDGMCV